MLKKQLFQILHFIINILISNIIITILNYFNILNNNIINILNFILPLILIIINSYLLGKKTNKKGYLEGLKFGTIISSIFLSITLITNNYNIKVFIYYIIIIISSILSSTMGINKKKNT
ncbi:MAG: TIGR04086 family membrane protein [Bacilli bacterium]|nr:TIGR04086 family membrane protein [Bacilli bacterium]